MKFKYLIGLILSITTFICSAAYSEIRNYDHELHYEGFTNLCKEEWSYLNETSDQCLSSFLTCFRQQREQRKYCSRLLFARVALVDNEVVGFAFAVKPNGLNMVATIYTAVKKSHEFTDLHRDLVENLFWYCRHTNYYKIIVELPKADTASIQWYEKLRFYKANTNAVLGKAEWDCDIHYASRQQGSNEYEIMAKDINY